MASPHRVTQPAFRPSVSGRNGAVASGHPLASQAGLTALIHGGNAIDAAIATAAALGVVEPHASGVGGDGFLLIHDAGSRGVYGVNATGPAPKKATRERYVAEGGIPMRGILSVSVPGLVDGWLVAHARFGRLPLDSVLAPAIDLAESGFPVSHKLAASLKGSHIHFTAHPGTTAIYAPDGVPLRPGERLVQRDLGATLRAVAAEGRKAFYEGAVAKAMAAFSREQGGLLDDDDFAAFHARWETPIAVDYHGYRVHNMPPNSSGHILLQELNLVGRFDLAGMGWGTGDSIHLMVEAKKLAFADRERYVADPDFLDIPIKAMLSKGYAKKRARHIDLRRAAFEMPAGLPESREDTTCFCVADREGNAVCVLQSVQSGFGSCRVADGTGVLLNNRMTYWHLEENHPNCLAPGKRVRHTMNPVIALKGGRAAIVCGTPGADTQVQTNLQLLTSLIHWGFTPQEAVEAPRWRSLQNPMESTVPHTCEDLLHAETRFDAAVLADLESRGHRLHRLGDWGGAGSAQVITLDPVTGALSAGSDPRRDGYAVAF